MKQMNFRRLSYFVTLADTLHFGHAAEALYISQPALSSEIRKLEGELGVTLFHRRPRTSLTRDGEVLARRARTLLAAADRFSSGADDLAQGIAGTVTVGSVQTLLMSRLPQAIATIEAAWPGITIETREMSTGEQLEMLAVGGIDLTCGHSAGIGGEFESLKIASEDFVLCTPPDLVAAHGGPPRSLADVADRPFIIFRREISPYYWDTVMTICRTGGIEPRVRHQTTTWQVVIDLVRQGMGVSVVPAVAVDGRTDVRTTPLPDSGVHSESWLVMRSEDAESVVGRVHAELGRLMRS